MKIPNTQYDKNPFGRTDGQTDRWVNRDEDVWKDGQTGRWAERQTNKQTDMTKLTVTFQNSVNANKN